MNQYRNQCRNQYIIWLFLVGLLNIFFLKLPIFLIAVSITIASIWLYTFISKGLKGRYFSLVLDSILISLVLDAIWLMKSTDYRSLAIIAAIITGRFTEGFLIKKRILIRESEAYENK